MSRIESSRQLTSAQSFRATASLMTRFSAGLRALYGRTSVMVRRRFYSPRPARHLQRRNRRSLSPTTRQVRRAASPWSLASSIISINAFRLAP